MQGSKHILILASWYPNRYTPFNGDFVQRIAEVTSEDFKVTVLHITPKIESGLSELVVNTQNEQFEEWVFYQKKSPKALPLRSFLKEGVDLFKQIEKKRGKVDFCHVQVIWKMGILAYWLKKKYGLNYFVTEHWTGYLPQNYQLQKNSLRLLSKLVARNVTRFITVSQNLGSTVKALGFIKKDSFVLPNIVRWIDDSEKTQNLETPFKFIHLSNFRDEQKNVSGIIKAFANALQSNSNIQLILGGSSDVKEYKALAKKLEIPDKNIEFLSEMEHKVALKQIAESNMLVCFSNYETFAITCAEALCMGVPVIYTPCGGPEEYISSSQGIRVEIKDEKALSQAFIDTSTEVKTFNSEKIKTEARALFSNQNWKQKLKEIYK